MNGRLAISTVVPCSNSNLAIVKEAMNERLKSAQCVMNGNCTQEVQTTCEQSSRKRRAAQTIDITIELQANLLFDGSGLNFDEMIDGEGPSSDFKRLLFAVSYLENTTQTLLNESESMFTFTVGGITYVTDQTSVVVTPSVQCPQWKSAPSIFVWFVFQVTVPAGSYSNSVDAVFCPKGTFQERPGQMSCTPCPAGTSTEGIGSDNSTDCSVTDLGSVTSGSTPAQTMEIGAVTPADVTPKQQNTDDNVKANVAVIVGIVTVAIVVFAAVLVTGILVYNYKSQNNVRRIGQSEVSLQPFPLFNLPVKSEKTDPAKDAFMNRYNF